MKRAALLFSLFSALLLCSCGRPAADSALPTDDEWVFVSLTADEVALSDALAVSYVIAESGYVEVELYEISISPFYWEGLTEHWYAALPIVSGEKPAGLGELLSEDPEDSEVKIFSAHYERGGERFHFEAAFFEGEPVAGVFGYLRVRVKAADF